MQSGIPAWLAEQWQTWWLANQQGSQVEVAREAGLCPSYITRIRGGHIPRRDMVEALGTALGKRDEALLMAGYLPGPGYAEQILKALKKRRA